MEHLWEKSGVLNSLKINKFTKDKTNLYKCTMTIFKNVTVDTFTETGYYKSASDAKYHLEQKLREKKNELYPYEKDDNKNLKWSFSYIS